MGRQQMALVAYLLSGPTFHHHGMWRHPFTDARFLSADLYQNLARVLELGRFDALFFADTLAVYDRYANSFEATVKYGGQGAFQLDPVPLLSVIAASTRYLGLGATISTTFYEPYHIARTLATLDHLSGGRVAWNVVTSFSSSEAQNFGKERLIPRESRYDRADEFLEVCFKLWDSWEDDAIVMNREEGIFADPSKVHYVNHEGRWLKARGPLSVPRPVQGRPVIMQAGASPRGREFAARWAEMVFTLQHSIKDMKEY
ncbi:MAG: NtaA/DmoA family FMN-dependent monooxygenase, partial [Clostridia bacterium]|nr:NtaA/DmoA family FMN-dependent monooxygenase [Clostridia bacterium]